MNLWCSAHPDHNARTARVSTKPSIREMVLGIMEVLTQHACLERVEIGIVLVKGQMRSMAPDRIVHRPNQ